MDSQPNIPMYKDERIEKYVLGKMSSKEMYAFEQEMQMDPFMADALEGYMNADMTQATKHLSDIEQQVGSQIQEKTSPVSIRINYRYIAIAASILAVVLIGTIFYRVQLADNSPAQVKNTPATLPTPPTTPNNTAVTPPLDSLSTVNDSVNTSIASNQTAIPNPSVKAATVAQPTTPAPATDSTALAVNDMSISVKEANKKANIHADAMAKESVVSAPVKDQLNEAKKSKPILEGITNNGNIVSTNSNRFDPPAAKSKKLIAKSSKPQVTNNNFIAADDKQTVKPREVVVAAAPAQIEIKAPLITTAVTPPATNAKPQAPLLTPNVGWPKYKEYINDQIKNKLGGLSPLIDKKGQPIKSLVVEFSLSDKGNPERVKLSNELDKKSRNAILQIITEGPTWSGDKKKQLVEIPLD